MATDHIRYDVLARDALRGVLRRVLTDAAEHGLPGEHHFFITFLSTAEGVKLSPRLLAQYPEEMTVILQHQFWDLVVTEDRFEVGLSFGGIPERLVVPFNAIKSFFDPSVQFGLQFEPADAATEAPAAKLPAAPRRPRALPAPPAAEPPRRRGRAGEAERRRRGRAARPLPQEIIRAHESSVVAMRLYASRAASRRVTAQRTCSWLDRQHHRARIHPHRDRQLRSDRGRRRPLLGRADRRSRQNFRIGQRPHADADHSRARHRQARRGRNQPRTRPARRSAAPAPSSAPRAR